MASVLGEWLSAGRLDLPSPLLLDITIGDPAPPIPDLEQTPFRQPEIAIHVHRGGGTDVVHVRWDVAPAEAVIGLRPDCAQVVLSPAAAARMDAALRTFFAPVVIFLVRRIGWHHVHAATAIDRGGKGWLLAGNSGAGKSTTAALLASRGWRIGTDDLAFLSPAGDRVSVVGFREPLALRPGGVALLDRLGAGPGAALTRRDKTGYWPEDLGGQWTPRVEPDVVCFTSIGDATTTVAPLRPKETLASLVRWSAWVILEPALADQHLQLITALARQARGFRVTLGRDLFEQRIALEDLVS